MSEIVIIITCLIALIMLKLALNIKLKDIKNFKVRTNKELQDISRKFPEDKKICETILNKLDNKNVKVIINEEYNSCLYTIYNNKITIGKFKENYMKIQTIAHECVHSCQKKITLWFNFIVSNIYNLYFVIILILTFFDKIQYTDIYLFILTILGIIQYTIRNSLENEAMLRAPYVAKEYIEENNIMSMQEEEKLLKEYSNVNKIGIPFINYLLIQKNIVKIIVYCFVVLI